MKINIIGKRYIFFIFSLIIIVPGLILLAINGLPLSIDFTSGSYLEVKFESGNPPPPAEVIRLYQDTFNAKDVQVKTTEDGSLIVRSAFLRGLSEGSIITALEQRFNDKITLVRSDAIDPVIGKEVAYRALAAVGIAAVMVILYIFFAFRGLSHAFRYGICAIIAMLHDVLILVSLGVIGGILFNWQVDALFLTAVLTVIGFSVQDKIVVFDRIRENSQVYRRLSFETLVNHSIVQTLQRSINTQLMTVEFMLLALALFGGIALREFAVILLVGLLSGTYSSIFIAASSLVVWENHEWKTWFHRGSKEAVA